MWEKNQYFYSDIMELFQLLEEWILKIWAVF